MQDGGKKGKGKGKDRKGGYKSDERGKNGEGRPPKQPSGPSIFEGKAYEKEINNLLETTEARMTDFDARAVALLDTLQEHNKAEEAIKTVGLSLKNKNRDEIKNWKAYVHTILRKVDPEAYNVHKTTKAVETPKGKTVNLAESLEPPKTLSASAVEFKPGGKSHVTESELTGKANPKGKVQLPEDKFKPKPKNADGEEPGFLECCFRRSD